MEWIAASKNDHHLVEGDELIATAHDSGAWSIRVDPKRDLPNNVMGRSGWFKAGAKVANMTDRVAAAFLLDGAKQSVHRVLSRYGWEVPATIKPAKKEA